MRARRIRAVCVACGWRGTRTIHETPPLYGVCHDCGAPVARGASLDDKRAARAKAELAGQEGEARTR